MADADQQLVPALGENAVDDADDSDLDEADDPEVVGPIPPIVPAPLAQNVLQAPVAMAAPDELDDLLLILNGDPYEENAGGEAESNLKTHEIIVAADTPGSDDGHFFTQIDAVDAAPDRAPIVLNGAQACQFMYDQAAYLRIICGVDAQAVSDDALIEICVLRLLAYKHRLVAPGAVAATYHCRYNEAKRIDTTVDGNALTALRGNAGYAAVRAVIIGKLNAQRDHITWIIQSFTDIVCCVAYVFRAKGHHFMDGYDDTYIKLFKKVNKTNNELVSGWNLISVHGLHAIMPLVLDTYWSKRVRQSRVSAALVVRHTVAGAGTAAIFAIKAAWEDAKHVYGGLLRNCDELEAQLNEVYVMASQTRWDHTINAKYYGANTERISIAALKSVAGTVFGVYESVADDATIIRSPALAREAQGAPLQRNIAGFAAKAFRSLYIATCNLMFVQLVFL